MTIQLEGGKDFHLAQSSAVISRCQDPRFSSEFGRETISLLPKEHGNQVHLTSVCQRRLLQGRPRSSTSMKDRLKSPEGSPDLTTSTRRVQSRPNLEGLTLFSSANCLGFGAKLTFLYSLHKVHNELRIMYSAKGGGQLFSSA